MYYKYFSKKHEHEFEVSFLVTNFVVCNDGDGPNCANFAFATSDKRTQLCYLYLYKSNRSDENYNINLIFFNRLRENNYFLNFDDFYKSRKLYA